MTESSSSFRVISRMIRNIRSPTKSRLVNNNNNNNKDESNTDDVDTTISATSSVSTVLHVNKGEPSRSVSRLVPPTPRPRPLLEEGFFVNADTPETRTKETRDKKKKKAKSRETHGTGAYEKKHKKKRKEERKEQIVHDDDDDTSHVVGCFPWECATTQLEKMNLLEQEKHKDDTSAASSITGSPKIKTKKQKKTLSPEHEEFREKVSFAFALCRRQMLLRQQQQQQGEASSDDDEEECCFLPLLSLHLDKTNLHTLKRLVKKNADLRLHKLHLYQLTFGSHGHWEAFLDIFRRTFPSIGRIVLSSNSLQIQDIHAITERFENLAELCLYGGSHALAQNALSPLWDETWCRLASRVARDVTLPRMGRCLPQGFHRGLAKRNCIVERLNLKIDAKEDVERLVDALCQGRSVRNLRLESATCQVGWLGELLKQYDLFEQLELYQCQNTHEQDDDRLAAWMI